MVRPASTNPVATMSPKIEPVELLRLAITNPSRCQVSKNSNLSSNEERCGINPNRQENRFTRRCYERMTQLIISNRATLVLRYRQAFFNARSTYAPGDQWLQLPHDFYLSFRHDWCLGSCRRGADQKWSVE